MSTRDISCGKGGRCVWLTTYHPCSAEKKIQGLNPPGHPWASPGLLQDDFTFTFTYLRLFQKPVYKSAQYKYLQISFDFMFFSVIL